MAANRKSVRPRPTPTAAGIPPPERRRRQQRPACRRPAVRTRAGYPAVAVRDRSRKGLDAPWRIGRVNYSVRVRSCEMQS